MTFKYEKRKGISFERYLLYWLIRELNSLQEEVVKIKNETVSKLLDTHFFWRQCQLSYSQLVWILMIDITLQFENVIPDLIGADQCTQNEVIFSMPYAL